MAKEFNFLGKKYKLADNRGFARPIKIGQNIEYCGMVGKVLKMPNEDDICIEVENPAAESGKMIYNVPRKQCRELAES